MNKSASTPRVALPRLALIAGPTASGKSALAIALAEETGGVVINADASQVYRDLRVLTARPSVENEARVPHRLFGHIDGAESCSAARWAAEARATIDAVHATGRLPILVGGSGLYIRTLLDGIAPVPGIDPAIRDEVRAMSVAEAHTALTAADPAAAQRLSPNDTTRVARALEVVRSTGRPIAAWQEDCAGGIGDRIDLAPLIVLPDRDMLLERCDARLAAMFNDGAVEEVQALRARADVPADAPVMRAIGVREVSAMIDGTMSRDDALTSARLATRQYAKRQYTWFRNQPPPNWPRIDLVSYDVLKHYFNLWP
ncbi:tRNA (adenosine(37)-N6)-dimethylallyltransferase MiaA [Sphingomonas sp. SUN019]|uniref:tRNA (adenosine(37)-N6)-dimethylallyltransferase MiaA n=1 Tax=Sphingomonas sp. SUN019 TaxID=2937788 RepID=UPI002164B29E|nr:tRNA (adenosine(37)-N6)-dimethylallyltransferase MiaA [Sphingomonas sp. SUN019]UVO52072.1 tRNA (adenosine(37)-N6)-dimethylallyltransferase MiaA [Sphingomonas sp. SUN019]